jgi:hypothetical protein
MHLLENFYLSSNFTESFLVFLSEALHVFSKLHDHLHIIIKVLKKVIGDVDIRKIVFKIVLQEKYSIALFHTHHHLLWGLWLQRACIFNFCILCWLGIIRNGGEVFADVS